jgi:hypothetical protein
MVGSGDFDEIMGFTLGSREIGGKLGDAILVECLRRKFCLSQH